MSMFWKDMTTRGAVIGGFLGLITAVLGVVLSPAVWEGIFGFAKGLRLVRSTIRRCCRWRSPSGGIYIFSKMDSSARAALTGPASTRSSCARKLASARPAPPPTDDLRPLPDGSGAFKRRAPADPSAGAFLLSGSQGKRLWLGAGAPEIANRGDARSPDQSTHSASLIRMRSGFASIWRTKDHAQRLVGGEVDPSRIAVGRLRIFFRHPLGNDISSTRCSVCDISFHGYVAEPTRSPDVRPLSFSRLCRPSRRGCRRRRSGSARTVRACHHGPPLPLKLLAVAGAFWVAPPLGLAALGYWAWRASQRNGGCGRFRDPQAWRAFTERGGWVPAGEPLRAATAPSTSAGAKR